MVAVPASIVTPVKVPADRSENTDVKPTSRSRSVGPPTSSSRVVVSTRSVAGTERTT